MPLRTSVVISFAQKMCNWKNAYSPPICATPFAVQPNGGNQPSQEAPKEVEVLNEDDKKFFSETTQTAKVP